MSNVIEVRNLNKSFQSLQVLDNLSFNVLENHIFGIIGPDGAGKSTLFRILTTLLLPDSGECLVNGLEIQRDFMKIRSLIGYMPGNFSLYMDLSVAENLEFFASIFNVRLQENYYLIEKIYSALSPFANRRVSALSGGMKQKLALCCALIHKPKILFLDEPTTGVDAVSRKEFWDILQSLKSQMTVVVSTPYMDEASLCDEIALIFNGKFLGVNTPSGICQQFSRNLYALKNVPPIDLPIIRDFKEVRTCYLFGDCFHITLKDGVRLEDFCNQVSQKYHASIESITPNVEDCFMEFLQ